MASKIGVLTVDMRLLSKKFEAGIKRANMGLTKMRANAMSATKSLKGMHVGIAGLVGVAGFGAMIKSSLAAGDAIGKMSDRLNISTESLSAFRHLVELNGESTENFEKSITRMARSIGEAERGFGTGKKAFEDLGISLDMLLGKSADEQFLIISDAINNVESSAQQASIASDIFGRSGVGLLNTIAQGRDGFKSAKEEVDKYGLALSRVDAAMIEAANDAILRSQQVMKGAALTATTQLAPYIEQVANEFVKLGTEGNGFAGIFKNIVTKMVVGWSYIKNAFNGVIFVFDLLKSGLYKMGAVWADVFAFIYNDVLVPTSEKILRALVYPFEKALEFASEYSDSAKSMLEGLNESLKFDRVEGLDNFAFTMNNAALEAQSNMYDALSKIVPIDEIKENLDKVFVAAEERAEAAVKKTQLTPQITYDDLLEDKAGEEEVKKKVGQYDFILDKEKSFQEKLGQIKQSGSKKFAALQKAIALKDAIVTGFSAVQKAWASAPFPYNVPAVALTGAAVAANIQGIRGQAHSGIDYVPREGTWLLDKGERVVDSRTNQDLKNFIGESGQPGGGVTYNFSPTIMSRRPDDILGEYKSVEKQFIRMMQANMGKPI